MPFKQPTHLKVALTIARLTSGVSALLAACLLAGGCATVQPALIGARELAEAQTFPFYRVYWVGPRFSSYRLAGAEGLPNYNSAIGESVYYGSCLSGKSTALGGSGCVLPLQVTTVLYARRANAPLGPQRNTILRGVPAVIYDGGSSIELYSGRLAIDVLSNRLSDGLRAVRALRPLNAPGSAVTALPPPVFCPGLSPHRPAALRALLLELPGHPCQKVAQTLAVDRALFGKG
ncbi:MAG: hypothetical protein ACRDLF_16825 [Solirubrobacteraceae bacterium]